MLKIKNLSVTMDERELLTNINLEIKPGERHLLCGHNGSGKSTLAQTIIGIPEYKIKSGQIFFNDYNITKENITSRALMGIFLGAQHVPEIPGLTLISFLKHSCAAHTHYNDKRDLSMAEFLEKLETIRTELSIPREWLNRSINVGFSGGERKRIMLLRLMLCNPKLAILDEPDSGADIETKKLIAQTIQKMSDTTFMVVSHQTDFTDMINITNTTTLSDGKIMIK